MAEFWVLKSEGFRMMFGSAGEGLAIGLAEVLFRVFVFIVDAGGGMEDLDVVRLDRLIEDPFSHGASDIRCALDELRCDRDRLWALYRAGEVSHDPRALADALAMMFRGLDAVEGCELAAGLLIFAGRFLDAGVSSFERPGSTAVVPEREVARLALLAMVTDTKRRPCVLH